MKFEYIDEIGDVPWDRLLKPKGGAMNLEEMLTERARFVTRMEAREAENEKDKGEVKALDDAIMAKYDAEGMTSIKIPGLGSFILSERTFASIPPEKKEAAIPAFKRHFPELVQEVINAQTLGAFVREARKNGAELPAEIIECIKESKTRFMTWRRG